MLTSLVIKWTVSREFLPFFCLSGPLLKEVNSFENFLVFAKIFDNKVRNLSVRAQAILALGKLYKYCFWISKHTQVLFWLDCSLMSVRVRGFQNLLCQRSHCHVRVVNNYVDTVSA